MSASRTRSEIQLLEDAEFAVDKLRRPTGVPLQLSAPPPSRRKALRSGVTGAPVPTIPPHDQGMSSSFS
jgi:hypothetical protein